MKNKFLITNQNLINIKKIFCIIIAFLTIIPLINLSFYKNYNQKSNAIEQSNILLTSESTSNYSIFINEPSFSFVFAQNLYFFDSLDNNLKIFNLQNNTFYSNYLDLSDFGTLIDATICENYIFALFFKEENYSVQKIKLDTDNLLIQQVTNDSDFQSINLSKIHVTFCNDKFYISLTPKLDSETSILNLNSSPLILTLNKDDNKISHISKLNITELNSTINNSLFKIILTPSANNTYFNIILACASEIYASNLEEDMLNQNTINLTDTNFNRSLDTSNYNHELYAGVSLLAVNLVKLNGNNFILVTYNSTTLNGDSSAYTKAYSFNLSLFGTGSTFEAKATISNSITKYLTVSASGFSYPNGQNIEYILITYEDELSFVNYKISNPNIKINYFDEADFVYVKTNKNTGIFNSPWNSSPIILLENDIDLIIIGEGEITSQNYTIQDYKYCLFTNNKNNYLGFVKTENLTQKQNTESNISEVFTVIANTPLYSLPTKITGTQISSNLTAKIIMNIKEFSRLELIDTLCDYTSNHTIFIKVQVNGKDIGYIDTNQIQNKKNINIFITNNATIKLDNTNVFLSEDDKETVITTLNSGTRVQVTGTRNRKTGLTSITFSDEYGNTFSGFVISDSVKTDGWTNLQMLGSIFIAINFGILILIFYFKKKRLITRESKSIIEKNDTNLN